MSVTASARSTARTPVAGVTAAIAVAVFVDPSTTHVPLCPFHSATGFYCPLCGGLRALHALSRGHVETAIRDNLLLVAAVAMLPVIAVYLRATGTDRHRRVGRLWVGLLVAVAAGFTIVRNMPLASALRPG